MLIITKWLNFLTNAMPSTKSQLNGAGPCSCTTTLVLRHPPYSLDMAANDLHLISSIQHFVDGKNAFWRQGGDKLLKYFLCRKAEKFGILERKKVNCTFWIYLISEC